jgi:hypothetical protein
MIPALTFIAGFALSIFADQHQTDGYRGLALILGAVCLVVATVLFIKGHPS